MFVVTLCLGLYYFQIALSLISCIELADARLTRSTVYVKQSALSSGSDIKTNGVS